MSIIREDLLSIFRRDLLGPAGGADEEIAESRVRERYLTGMLAPRKQAAAEEDDEPADEPSDRIIQPEMEDELAAAGPGNTEDGTPERGTISSPTLFPCSFGLTFGVSLRATAIEVEAGWGQYLREASQFARKQDGTPKLIWKRYQRGRRLAPIRLVGDKSFEQSIDTDSPEVLLKGRVRRYDNHWSVTLFLVNNQIEPRRRRDEAWVFQPELIVRSPEGEAIFERRSLKRTTRGADSDEMAMLDMLYRKRLEFATGHGVSVHVEADGTGACAYSVATRVIPQSEIRQSTSPTKEDFSALEGLPLDMKVLAETLQADLPAKLSPLVNAYRSWIEDRELEAQTPDLQKHKTAAGNPIRHCKETLGRLEDGIELVATSAEASEAFAFANRAMYLQRIRALMADEVRNGRTPDRTAVDIEKNRSWRVFQLAFLLINLRSLTDLQHPTASVKSLRCATCSGFQLAAARQRLT